MVTENTTNVLLRVLKLNTTSNSLRWFWSGIGVGILLGLAFFIRQPIQGGLSTVEGFWTPNVQYGAWFLANNRHLFSTNALPVISNYTSGLNYGSIDFTYTYLTGTSFILSGIRDVEIIGRVYLLTPWQGALLIPLLATAIYSQYTRLAKSKILPSHIIIIYAFSVFSNYPMVIWSSSGGFATPIGWAIFYCTYLNIFTRYHDHDHSWQWSTLLIVCILLMQPTYHTAALALTIFLVCIAIVQLRFHYKYLSPNTLNLAIIVFAAFLLYHAVVFFNDYGRLFNKYLSDIYRTSDQERLKYNISAVNMSIWWYIANYLSVLFPVGCVFFLAFIQKNLPKNLFSTYYYQIIWYISLIPLVCLLFAWDGFFGAYARVLQYGTLLSITSVAVLLATQARLTFALLVATIICVAVSTISMRTLDASSSNYITSDETLALKWISTKKGCNSVLFTDFRIGSAFGYVGCFGAVGPTARSLSARGQIEVLPALFYNGDGKATLNALNTITTVDHRKPDILLMSRRFLDPIVGIVLPDTRLKPMTEAQWSTYQHLPGWKIVYKNETTMVLVRIKV